MARIARKLLLVAIIRIVETVHAHAAIVHVIIIIIILSPLHLGHLTARKVEITTVVTEGEVIILVLLTEAIRELVVRVSVLLLTERRVQVKGILYGNVRGVAGHL